MSASDFHVREVTFGVESLTVAPIIIDLHTGW